MSQRDSERDTRSKRRSSACGDSRSTRPRGQSQPPIRSAISPPSSPISSAEMRRSHARIRALRRSACPRATAAASGAATARAAGSSGGAGA
eukprot:6173208-Pleurochrysis_carterae.AAC.1